MCTMCNVPLDTAKRQCPSRAGALQAYPACSGLCNAAEGSAESSSDCAQDRMEMLENQVKKLQEEKQALTAEKAALAGQAAVLTQVLQMRDEQLQQVQASSAAPLPSGETLMACNTPTLFLLQVFFQYIDPPGSSFPSLSFDLMTVSLHIHHLV